jgi:hypothetical protein
MGRSMSLKTVVSPVRFRLSPSLSTPFSARIAFLAGALASRLAKLRVDNCQNPPRSSQTGLKGEKGDEK